MKVWLGKYNVGFLSKIPFLKDIPRIQYVKIEEQDTWNACDDLAMIIHPILIKLKDNPYSFFVPDDCDVPEELRGFGDNEEGWKNKYEWVMDEMIYSFSCLINPDYDAVYFKTLPEIEFENSPDHNGNRIARINNFDWDKEGYAKNEERIKNGLLLFGRYFRHLWT